MSPRASVVLGLVAALCATTASGQEPVYRAGDLARILDRDGSPTYAARELAEILAPAHGATRGLRVAGARPGDPGSGVVPDLKVAFEVDSADLTPADKEQLDELARAMRSDALRSYRFKIAGHTEALGGGQDSARLSQLRAMSVVVYLSGEHAIRPDRLEAEGVGEREPADPDEPRSWVNRRVEVRTLEE